MAKKAWSVHDIPRLDDKIIVITGANSGIGFEAARALAGKGAHVVMACRKEGAAKEAIATIRQEHPEASLEFGELNLASLASVRRFSSGFLEKHDRLDVLVNNAGVMALPYSKTEDGFEMQLGTNHLGHFALTGLLLGHVLKTASSRVVTVSSSVHRIGRVRFSDLQSEKRYQRWLAYGQSKICNVLFSNELDRRLRARGLSVRSVSCHPGYAATNLQSGAARMTGSRFSERLWGWINRLFAQSQAGGALPTLFAAVAEDALGGDYIGPRGFMKMAGPPERQVPNKRSREPELAKKLWEVSEELTKVSYDALS